MKHRATKLIIGSIFLIFSLSNCHNSNDDSTPNPNPRNAKATPGEAEVVADTGYQHTVFDSAKEKCQHCHNDLYDTWTQSGHSVAWKGPIFQSQFQNVVRGRITQLDLSTAATKANNTKTFKGRVKFCVKCHAPAAWYSDDIKIDIEEIALGDGEVLDKAKLAELKAANESNLAGPNYDSTQSTTVVGFDNQGKVFKSTLHIGHAHNREGVNCAYCHSIETVRMLSASGDDGGKYTLAKDLPNSFSAGTTLNYSKDGENTEMNSFFRFAAAEIYNDYGNTPKVEADFDTNKKFDGRHTIKSIVKEQHTGGPYYGPFGVTGLTNHSSSDTVDRATLVKSSFTADPEAQHFEDQSKGLCLSCHQCALGRKSSADHFNTGCAIWQANSNFDNAASNTNTAESPKCTKCHMERVANKTVLHKWNSPDELFTAADGVSSHFDPEGTVGPVPEKYLNNHAFMATQIGNYSSVKLKSAVDATLSANKSGDKVVVNATLLNKTGHFFPGTMPMRRALMRVVATDSAGNKLPLIQGTATGISTFEDVSHQIATLPGETVQSGHDVVTRKAPVQSIVFTGQNPDLDGGTVNSQKFSSDTVTFVSPHPEGFPPPLGGATPTQQPSGLWRYEGKIKVRKIVDNTAASDNFTRIYGYQMISNNTGIDVIRPGMDSTGVDVTSLSPNERENYTIEFDASGITGDVTVTYKAYYMTKGANTQFPTAADGFLDVDAANTAKLLISELFEKKVTVQ